MDSILGKDLTNNTIARQFKLIKKIGSGAFGEIYLVQSQSKSEYAMKLERSDNKHPQIFFEAKLYNYLQGQDQYDKGIPKIHDQGVDGDYNYIVMDLLGPSLEELFNKHHRKLSLKSVLMLADQLIQRIEYIHSKQFIHRDIKPDNFLVGVDSKSSRLYIVDFGLAKRYITKEGHIPYKEGKSLTGTARYASINTHVGLEQSRRDDLESLGYVLMYLLRGQLPWQNMKAFNQKEKYQKIMEKKQETTPEQLCKGFPNELTQYLQYCRNLKFEDKPDYNYIRNLFKEAFRKQGYEWDYKFEWIKDEILKEDKFMGSAIPQRTVEIPTTTKLSNFQTIRAPLLIQYQSKLSQQASQEKKRNSSYSKNNNLNKQMTGLLAPKINTNKDRTRKY
ncbi:unnamed protein product [Paramecium pentaurelia]|uniref:Casein kinase I n=1 Tax=Paramecium pentaurelia TaxID=43138 RepID=A0A8S1SDE7_9CILI|nr:unnamed protein product [Paramecium pentaurelia]